jgi:hypothetical protein
MLRGTAAKPEMGSAGLCTFESALSTLTWIGRRPDWMVLRVGEQYL